MVAKSDSLRAVSAAANQPPPDIHALEARLAAALVERDAAIIERDAAIQRSDRLAHLLRQLQRMQFGRKSEKLDPDQFALALEDVEQAIAASEATDDQRNKAAAAARAKKRRSNRGALPAHLPRVHVTIEPEDRNCPCCRSPMHGFGAEYSPRRRGIKSLDDRSRECQHGQVRSVGLPIVILSGSIAVPAPFGTSGRSHSLCI